MNTQLTQKARSAIDEIAEFLLACGLTRTLELLAERGVTVESPVPLPERPAKSPIRSDYTASSRRPDARLTAAVATAISEIPALVPDEPTPDTQPSVHPTDVTVEESIVAHLRKHRAASVPGILRAVCPGFQEVVVERILQYMKSKKLVIDKRGRGGIVSWTLPIGGEL